MLKLKVIIASTRPGRVGLPLGLWFYDYTTQHSRFEVNLIDLAEVKLPFLDEPNHPRLRKYQHEHTKVWSAAINDADAFVFVTPEYNYGPPATLINALDFIYHEWHYKPAGFVSYGGVSGGIRSVQMLKQILTTLKVMPIPESVTIPFVNQFIEDGNFIATSVHEKAAETMLDELHRWAEALKAMRTPSD